MTSIICSAVGLAEGHAPVAVGIHACHMSVAQVVAPVTPRLPPHAIHFPGVNVAILGGSWIAKTALLRWISANPFIKSMKKFHPAKNLSHWLASIWVCRDQKSKHEVFQQRSLHLVSKQGTCDVQHRGCRDPLPRVDAALQEDARLLCRISGGDLKNLRRRHLERSTVPTLQIGYFTTTVDCLCQWLAVVQSLRIHPYLCYNAWSPRKSWNHHRSPRHT